MKAGSQCWHRHKKRYTERETCKLIKEGMPEKQAIVLATSRGEAWINQYDDDLNKNVPWQML